MRRAIAVLLAVGSVIAAVVIAAGLAGSAHRTAPHLAARAVPPPTLPGSVNIVRYQRGGATAFCNGDSCGASGSGNSSLLFTLPASSIPYRSTLTISFRYRGTGKNAAFAVSGTLSRSGPSIVTSPATRPLGPTGGRYQSATMVFRPALLAGGVNYTLGISADISHHVGSARIAVDHVTYALQAWING